MEERAYGLNFLDSERKDAAPPSLAASGLFESAAVENGSLYLFF